MTTGNLNLAVRRNKNRFPEDFVFRLSAQESKALLLLQFARTKQRGGRRTAPYVFTEQGVAMLSSVLRSERAALVNVAIMQAFVRLREAVATHKDLARELWPTWSGRNRSRARRSAQRVRRREVVLICSLGYTLLLCGSCSR